jgi:FMN-dependent NADH-azoreductase
MEDPVTELRLRDCQFPVVDESFLSKRDCLIGEGKMGDPMFELARQFASADEIVIAAPFWDLSFPAALKQYLEQINVIGITFRYNAQGIPEGLCSAKRLYYVTTAGGDFFPEEYGFGYVKALAQGFYGIRDVELIKATGLDTEGAPVEEIVLGCEEEIRRVRMQQAD